MNKIYWLKFFFVIQLSTNNLIKLFYEFIFLMDSGNSIELKTKEFEQENTSKKPLLFPQKYIQQDPNFLTGSQTQLFLRKEN